MPSSSNYGSVPGRAVRRINADFDTAIRAACSPGCYNRRCFAGCCCPECGGPGPGLEAWFTEGFLFTGHDQLTILDLNGFHRKAGVSSSARTTLGPVTDSSRSRLRGAARGFGGGPAVLAGEGLSFQVGCRVISEHGGIAASRLTLRSMRWLGGRPHPC